MPGKTVLVVDDDADILSLVTAALEYEGYRVLTAVDGEALTLAEQYHPDVIVLDLRMPHMDGIAVTRRLRANPRTATIPIVLSSAQDWLHGVPADVAVDDLLPKPYDLLDLYEKVEYWAHTEKTPS